MSLRQVWGDEDPFMQAHPALRRTQLSDSAWRDALICLMAIAFLMWLGLMTGAFDAQLTAWLPTGAGR